MDYLSGLNNKQREAVMATEGNLRVIAGAGSGKTKLLVSRYVYLVKEYGIDPANIAMWIPLSSICTQWQRMQEKSL